MINNRSFSSRYEKSSGRHVVAMWSLCSRCGRSGVAVVAMWSLWGRYDQSVGRRVVAMWSLCGRCGRYVVAMNKLVADKPCRGP